ncbi:MAG: transcriptional regulator BetI [Alphaproteobacteria bacterium]|nr:transcriptional regulator BetI [Alphaproteobacteria bacterium]
MPKVGIQDIRRQQFIDAAIAAIYKHGYTDLTVGQIAREAGLSAGNIHYYFGGKNELLEATMRWLLRTLRVVGIQRMAAARTPRQRVEALIDSNFDPVLFTPQNVSAWLHFWAEAPHSEALGRLLTINAGRVRSNLLQPMKHILPSDEAERVTTLVQVMMDGIWVQSAQTPGGMSPDEAGAMARDTFSRLIDRQGAIT